MVKSQQRIKGRVNKEIDGMYLKYDFKNMYDFISNENKLGSFSERSKYNNLQSTVFYDSYILPYNDMEGPEKDTLLSDTYIKNSALKNFRHLSLAHMLITHIGKLMKSDSYNAKTYENIYFTGGVLKTPFIKDIIKEDILSLSSIKNLNIIFPECDPSISFYKGVNYLSKLPDLETIMVSRQDYFDYGAEHLSYNYI